MLQWKTAVVQAIHPVGPTLLNWWKWCLREAESTYKVFLTTPLATREALVPTSATPAVWLQVEAWIRPKLLDSVTKDIKDWVTSRARQGLVDPTHAILFYVLKTFAPGGAEERVHLLAAIENPNCCSQPRAAQSELLRWKHNLRRCQELQIAPPDLLLAYRAMESIFSLSLIHISEPTRPERMGVCRVVVEKK